MEGLSANSVCTLRRWACSRHASRHCGTPVRMAFLPSTRSASTLWSGSCIDKNRRGTCCLSPNSHWPHPKGRRCHRHWQSRCGQSCLAKLTGTMRGVFWKLEEGTLTQTTGGLEEATLKQLYVPGRNLDREKNRGICGIFLIIENICAQESKQNGGKIPLCLRWRTTTTIILILIILLMGPGVVLGLGGPSRV